MQAMAAVMAVGEGHKLNVVAVCRDAGVSRKTFYKWLARYRVEGVDGLVARSRRPHRSPGQTVVEFEERVVLLRKELADAGLDHGATTIQWHLGREKRSRVVPSVATIHRILVRRGLVVPEPRKRPKSSWKRFEAGLPNEVWQIDAMDVTIATGVVKVFNIIDDHSRVAVASRVVAHATSEQAWVTFQAASAQWGPPAGMLSDNGLCFSGKLRGFEVFFEAQLRDAGIKPSTGRAYHPQTTGKVERFQQTLRKWIAKQRLARSIPELQRQLDRFTTIYNLRRPHQGIGGITPITRWNAQPPARPSDTPLPHPPPRHEPRQGTINAAGNLRIDKYSIGLGIEWAGHTATTYLTHNRATVFVNNQLVRHLQLDPTRTYQPTHRKRGGPKRLRIQS